MEWARYLGIGEGKEDGFQLGVVWMGPSQSGAV